MTDEHEKGKKENPEGEENGPQPSGNARPEEDVRGEADTAKADSTDQEQSDSALGVPESSKPESSKPESSKPKSRKWGGLAILLVSFIVTIVISGLAITACYYLWEAFRKKNNEVTQFETRFESIEGAVDTLAAVQGRTKDQTTKIDTEIKNRFTDLENRLRASEQQVAAQRKRLMSMSTTSRDDWLLAEAEYLLRLANQRVMIEKSPENADALLVEADAILRDLADPDLHVLRQAIANDLVALRSARKIDKEGIYFILVAMASQVESLPTVPTRQLVLSEGNKDPAKANVEVNAGVNVEATGETNGEPSAGGTTEPDLDKPEPGAWQKFKGAFVNVFSFMDRYVRVRATDNKPPPLLSPESSTYLQLNLRLKLERAQLALLREQQQIYDHTLKEIELWLTRYYPQSSEVRNFKAQVDNVRRDNIVQELPDITHSLELLHDYITDLHNLKGVKPGVTKAPDS